jgi:hypothetical protein
MTVYSEKWSPEDQCAAAKKWRQRNSDKAKAGRKARYDRIRAMRFDKPLETIRLLWHDKRGDIKRRRSKEGQPPVEFTVKFADLDWPELCPVFGIKLDYTGQTMWHMWTLDRLDPEGGYVKGNVFVISQLANTIKSMGTAEQHRQVADWMEKMGAKPKAVPTLCEGSAFPVFQGPVDPSNSLSGARTLSGHPGGADAVTRHVEALATDAPVS